MVFGASPDSSMISTSPDLTTKNLKSRSPTLKSACPSGYFFRNAPAQLPSFSICASLSVGNAIARKLCSAMSRPPYSNKLVDRVYTVPLSRAQKKLRRRKDFIGNVHRLLLHLAFLQCRSHRLDSNR